MKKLIIICIMAVGMMLSTVCAYAASGTIEFTSSPDMSQISATVETVGDKEKTPKKTTVNNTSVWHIGSTTWSDENLCLNLNDGIASLFKSLNDVYLDVVYYDDTVPASTSQSLSFFEVKYRTVDGIEKRTDTVMCTGTKKFKTVRFKLTQASLDNGFNGSDVVITTRSSKYGYANNGIKIKSVTITSSEIKTPIRGDITTDSTGNIFFDNGEKCSFKISLQNYDEIEQNAECEFYVKDGDKVLYEISKTVKVAGGERSAYYLDYVPRIYGAYVAELKVKSGNGEYNIQRDFSYCRAAGTKNNDIGVSVHLCDEGRDPDRSLELTAKAGFGTVRDGIDWKDYEKKVGIYELTASQEAMLKDARKNGVKMLILLGSGNKLYTKTETSIPTTDTELNAFYNYVKNLVSELEENYGDVIEAYELWNEPNHKSFNNELASGADYAKLAQITRKAFDDIKVNKKLIGLAMTGIHDTTSYEWCVDAYKAGAGKYLDAMSLHPYYLTMGPEEFDLNGKIDMIHSLADTYGGNRETWITEHGWASIDNIPQVNQAKYIVRSFAMAMTDPDLGKYFVYQLQDGGNLPNYREHQYGLLKKWADTEVPYAAKKVYPALCTLNWLFSGKSHVATEKIGTSTRYRFESSNKEKLHIIFNSDETSSVYIPAEVPKNMTISVYDMYGNDLGIDNINRSEGINVTGEPIYVIYRWDTPAKKKLNAQQAEGYGKVTIGTENAKGSKAEVMVLKDGKSFEDFKRSPYECVAYFNTVDINNGCFTDSFYIKRLGGNMRAIVYYPDDGTCEYAEFELKNAHFCEITNGTITCKVDISESYDAYYAEYNGDQLIGVHKYTGKYTTEISDEADTVVMYLWEKDNMVPIAETVRIEKP